MNLSVQIATYDKETSQATTCGATVGGNQPNFEEGKTRPNRTRPQGGALAAAMFIGTKHLSWQLTRSWFLFLDCFLLSVLRW